MDGRRATVHPLTAAALTVSGLVANLRIAPIAAARSSSAAGESEHRSQCGPASHPSLAGRDQANTHPSVVPFRLRHSSQQRWGRYTPRQREPAGQLDNGPPATACYRARVESPQPSDTEIARHAVA